MKKTIVLFLWGIVSALPAMGASVDAAAASGGKYLAAGLAVGIACVGAGIAVGKIGAAALGVLSEKPELSGKAFTFLGLAEGICLWGFLVAMLILFL
jgi:V/A-type H+-transporting ATPase subunit K